MNKALIVVRCMLNIYIYIERRISPHIDQVIICSKVIKFHV